MKPGDIRIADFTYTLPEERIAFKPLEKRDEAKLLLYEEGAISRDSFKNFAAHLPAGTLLVLNNTRVINARLLFRKTTGARIEIFCLEPAGSIRDYSSVMKETQTAQWVCLIGGISKWTAGPLQMEVAINGKTCMLQATLLHRKKDANTVLFSWTGGHSFIEVINAAGAVPLPPYIKRQPEKSDENRYQTVFAQQQGSVAAPTAGLHFTEEVLRSLSDKLIDTTQVTLHVGAGTFMPVKTATMQEHDMHEEYIDVSAEAIEKLLSAETIAAVGTTALRTIESLYWLGCKAILNPDATALTVEQWDAYDEAILSRQLTKRDALKILLSYMQARDKKNIFTKTKLLIVPGYRFRLADHLSTNFHQPHSTLLLLVAAAIGDDWRRVYAYALDNDFRFLSYGDTSLLKISNKA